MGCFSFGRNINHKLLLVEKRGNIYKFGDIQTLNLFLKAPLQPWVEEFPAELVHIFFFLIFPLMESPARDVWRLFWRALQAAFIHLTPLTSLETWRVKQRLSRVWTPLILTCEDNQLLSQELKHQSFSEGAALPSSIDHLIPSLRRCRNVLLELRHCHGEQL